MKVNIIKHSDIARCPNTILTADHYRKDGTCRCYPPRKVKVLPDLGEFKEE